MEKKTSVTHFGAETLRETAPKADRVLVKAKQWEPIETKLIVWSFLITGMTLLIGLAMVPTSIFP